MLINKDNMHTYLDVKNATANILGRTDGATPNDIRDNAINDSRQNELANAYPFSWLEKPTTVTTDSDGKADLPEDYNIAHKPKSIKNANDDSLGQINKESFLSTTSDRIYFIDRNTATDRWQINTNNPSEELSIIYYHIPAELTDDTDIDIIPDKRVIAMFAAATYWLSSERDETNSDRFALKAEKRLKELIRIDKRANPLRISRGSMYTVNQGWNTGD